MTKNTDPTNLELPKCCACGCDALICLEIGAHSGKEWNTNKKAIAKWRKTRKHASDMTKTLPTLAVGDAVVLVLDNGNQHSAIVTHFSLKNESHRYAHFAWKTGQRSIETLALHSCKWAERVLAVFPKGCKFLAV